MSSPETFLAFGGLMLIIAVLCVAIDWFGKPIKRRFVAKMYRYPDERRPRAEAIGPTPWMDATFVLPVTPELASDLAEQRRLAALAQFASVSPGPPAGAHLPVLFDQDVAVLVDAAAVDEHGHVVGGGDGDTGRSRRAAIAAAPVRPSGWAIGEYIYNLTIDGREPSPATVRSRYWRNVAAADAARVFGPTNLERMAAGKPPRRRNPRSGRVEMMVLPSIAYHDGGGDPPVPYWPGGQIDPFVDR